MLQEFLEMNEFPGDSVASRRTMGMALAATSKSMTGFDVTKNFPPGTNFDEMMRATNGKMQAWATLKFQFERGILSGLHSMLENFANLPQPVQSIWDYLRTKLVPADDSEHYDPREPTSLSEIAYYLDPGPKRVATALEFRRSPHVIGLRKPETLTLANGEISRPTRSDLDAWARAKEIVREFEATFEEREAMRVAEEVANLVFWACQTSSVEQLVIYERRGLLMDHGEELFDTINNKLEEISYNQRRKTTVRFGTQNVVTNDYDLEVIISCHNSEKTTSNMSRAEKLKHLIGTTDAPDLFIARNGSTEGFPMFALTNAVIFSPQTRCRFFARDRALEKVDWIKALKHYYLTLRDDRAKAALID